MQQIAKIIENETRKRAYQDDPIAFDRFKDRISYPNDLLGHVFIIQDDDNEHWQIYKLYILKKYLDTKAEIINWNPHQFIDVYDKYKNRYVISISSISLVQSMGESGSIIVLKEINKNGNSIEIRTEDSTIDIISRMGLTETK
ncbi:MAG TPA: hypothetical protein VK541_24830 [Pedobacter sp.]|uniref:hypothetical protein n=1 Tax=Pedobacter sp. TaxID=1411316 RepID=UPI002BEF5AC1|nr:hypothetical protein [Pedobacter sp.]HMI05737.1 hypothetical protein [Pedobacter sp.]